MRAETGSRRSAALAAADPPDLASQLETLLHAVWECEEDWLLNDRIDLALRREQASARAVRTSHPTF